MINGVLIDNAENVDAAIPMCNLLECSKNYRKATRSLRDYYRDEANGFPANNYNANSIINSQYFENKTSITGKISNANQENGKKTERENTMTRKNLEIIVPLKKFW